MRSIKYACLPAIILAAGCGPSVEPKSSFDVNAFVVEATIEDVQTAIADKKTTCSDIVGAYLRRIEAYDKSTGLNAITVLNPSAMAEAGAADEAQRAGRETGPLFCTPILVKDNYDTGGLETTAGSIALKGFPPTKDAFVVARLRAAGAIIVAKTNMAEWAFSPRQSVSSSYGVTANAYALDHVPAGSSGGTASGVAASFAVAGLGSDTGNSIRGPSSHLSLFGIRSTLGAVSRNGVVPLAFDRDIVGPMTRTVEDGARIYEVMAGADAGDVYTTNPEVRREANYSKSLDADALRGKRIGVLRALAKADETDPEILALFEIALKDLEAAGATIVDPFEIRNLAAHLDDDTYFCPRFRYDLAEYLKARGGDTVGVDLPALLEKKQYSDDPRVKGGIEFFLGFPRDVHPSAWETPCPDYFDHPGRQQYKNDVIASMDEASLDAIAYPSWTQPPAALDRGNEDYRGDNSQLIAPATGMPAVTAPMGFTHGSLPAGLQILARPYAEGLLFSLAYSYEQKTHHRRPPAGFEALE